MITLSLLQMWEKVWESLKVECKTMHFQAWTYNVLRSILQLLSSGYLQEGANFYYFISNKPNLTDTCLCLDRLMYKKNLHPGRNPKLPKVIPVSIT